MPLNWTHITSEYRIDDQPDPPIFESAVLGDVNNDGLQDIIVARSAFIGEPVSPDDPKPLIFLNLGGGRFIDGTEEVFSEDPAPLEWANDTIVADFNGDALNDILFIDHGREIGEPPFDNYFNTLYLSTPTGLVNATDGITQDRSFWHGAQNVADVDGDGDLDFAAAALADEIVDIFVNDGTGRFANESATRLADFITAPLPTSRDISSGPGTVAFIDGNGDGHPDLITAPYSNTFPQFTEAETIHIFLNDGAGNFTGDVIELDGRPTDMSAPWGYQSIHVADFDGNGLEDFIAVAEFNNPENFDFGTLGSQVAYYSQTLAGVFVDVTAQSFENHYIAAVNHSFENLDNFALNELFLGDIDNDGDIDVMQPYAFGVPGDISSAIYTNTNGVFSPFQESESFSAAEAEIEARFPAPDAGYSRQLMGDINNDGVADIISFTGIFNDGVVSEQNPYGFSWSLDVIFSSGVTSYFGFDAAETLIGTSVDESFEARGGDDVVDGADGTDTARFLHEDTYYTLQLGDSVRISDRSGDDGTDRLSNIEMLSFANAAFELFRFNDVANLSAEEFSSFAEMYIAYFNRAPDAAGLMFWANAFANGVSLAETAEFFALSPEAQVAFPAGTDNVAFVSTVYDNVLGRQPDAAGQSFWIGVLDSGAVSRSQFVLEVLRGARAEPTEDADQAFVSQQLADQQYLDDKIDIGLYFSAWLGMSDTANATDVMALFDGSGNSKAAAKAAADEDFVTAEAFDGSGEFLIQLRGVIDDPFAIA